LQFGKKFWYHKGEQPSNTLGWSILTSADIVLLLNGFAKPWGTHTSLFEDEEW
jgi:hypothetical protein